MYPSFSLSLSHFHFLPPPLLLSSTSDNPHQRPLMAGNFAGEPRLTSTTTNPTFLSSFLYSKTPSPSFTFLFTTTKTHLHYYLLHHLHHHVHHHVHRHFHQTLPSDELHHSLTFSPSKTPFPSTLSSNLHYTCTHFPSSSSSTPHRTSLRPSHQLTGAAAARPGRPPPPFPLLFSFSFFSFLSFFFPSFCKFT